MGLDGGVARGGGGAAPERLVDGRPLVEAVEVLGEGAHRGLGRSQGHDGGHRGDADAVAAERLHLEPQPIQHVPVSGEGLPLGRRQVQHDGLQQALALEPAGGEPLHHLLEQHPLVGHVLIDDGDAVLVDGDDEGVAELAEGLHRPVDDPARRRRRGAGRRSHGDRGGAQLADRVGQRGSAGAGGTRGAGERGGCAGAGPFRRRAAPPVRGLSRPRMRDGAPAFGASRRGHRRHSRGRRCGAGVRRGRRRRGGVLQGHGRGGGGAQGLGDGAAQHLVHQGGLEETDLGLRRVHVDVDPVGRQLDEEVHLGPAFLDGGLVVGVGDRVGDGAVLHGPAVDEDVLRPPRATGGLSREAGHEPRHRDPRRLLADLDEVVAVLVELEQPVREALDRRPPREAAGPARQGEADPVPAQRELGDEPRDLGGLGAVRLQELAARGHVVEEVGDLDDGAFRRAGLARGVDHAAGHPHLDPARGAAGAGAQQQARHRGDARQGLAAEPQRGDGREVLDPPDLAGGVPLEGEPRLVGGHPLAVVLHPHETLAAQLDGDRDPRRPGVERVLDQLLDHRRGALDHLAGGDLVRQLGRQPHDARRAVFLDLVGRGRRRGVGGHGVFNRAPIKDCRILPCSSTRPERTSTLPSRSSIFLLFRIPTTAAMTAPMAPPSTRRDPSTEVLHSSFLFPGDQGTGYHRSASFTSADTSASCRIRCSSRFSRARRRRRRPGSPAMTSTSVKKRSTAGPNAAASANAAW